jgi:glycosyltransferase involved in cell wall biosynthesis
LAEALSSVLDGEFQNFEIIITDDAGVPENRNVVDSFRDSRTRYRRNSICLQSARNHREAARIARGQFVAILNDDDVWEPNLLATLVPIMDRYLVAVAFGDHHVMDAVGVVDERASQESSRRWKRDVLIAGVHHPLQRLAVIDQSLAMQAALIRRSAIDWEDCPAEVGPLYDLWLNYLLSRTGEAAYYVPERLARYRSHQASSTVEGGLRTASAAVFVYSRMLADPLMTSSRSSLTRRLRSAKLTCALALLERNHPREARRLLRSAIYPGQITRAGLSFGLSWMPGDSGVAVLRYLRRMRTASSAALASPQ